MRVSVYFNLHKRCYSIRSEQGDTRGWVIAHADDVLIRSPEFVVNQGGRARVLRERKKYVHAFVRGELLGVDHLCDVRFNDLCLNLIDDETLGVRTTLRAGRRFTYNPYRTCSFEYLNDLLEYRPCMAAELAYLSTSEGTFALYPQEDAA